MYLPAGSLGIDETGEEAPFVPLARQAGRDADGPAPSLGPQSALECVQHYLAGHMLGRNGNLAQCPEIADLLGQGEHDIPCETAQAPGRQFLPYQQFKPVPVECDDSAEEGTVRRKVDSPGLGPVEDFAHRLDCEVANPFAPGDQLGERAEQRDLFGGIGTIAVGHPRGPNDGITSFPGSQARGSQAGQAGNLMDFVGPFLA